MENRVFISHKNSDSALASRVARRVKLNGLETYLDVIDDALVRDGPDLADLLLERMSNCDQLIAVVSDNTKTSWWVPWEIGVGSEKGFRMASYSENYVSLPSYLTKWPALHSEEDIDRYCRLSTRTYTEIRKRTTTALNEDLSLSIIKREALNFHKDLLGELRRSRY
jgi:hypothetical protein